METQLWIVFALVSALCAAGVPLLQERAGANPYALVIWNKVFCALWALPFILVFGLPSAPMFYATMAAGSLLWCVSDILYFRALPQIGAGVMTRLLPGATLLTFLLWFIIDPALLDAYLANPLKTGVILGILCLAALSAAFLKRCTITRAAVRQVWFVILAAAIGPILAKLSLSYTDLGGNRWHAAFAFLFVNSVMMLMLWAPYYLIRRPVDMATLVARPAWATGLKISLCVAGMVVLNSMAYMGVDNPAFVAVLLMTDAVWVLVAYRFLKRQEEGNIIAGLGIVLSAMALILTKSLL